MQLMKPFSYAADMQKNMPLKKFLLFLSGNFAIIREIFPRSDVL